jgi:outer membrane lipoprotein-sorting protein
MNQTPRLTRRARWAVPSGAVAAVGVVVAGSVLTTAQAAPALPARTPAQLIAAIAATKSAPSALSGTITWNAALGLPDLPSTGGPMSITSLLTGSHTVKIWYARPGQLRLALPVPLGETDLRVDGRQIWLWDSQTNTATHVVLPAAAALPMGSRPGPLRHARQQWNTQSRGFAPAPASPNSGEAARTSAESFGTYSVSGTTTPPTPQQVARQLLAAIGPTTAVSVQSNVVIAGRAAYQLTLAPKNPGSLVGRVSIAVDASRYLPLRVQVFARGSASPAYQVGYTALSFARPAASNFGFTPPPGAKVKTIRPLAGSLPGALSGHGAGFIAPPGMITCPAVRAPLKGKPTGRRIGSAKCAMVMPGPLAGHGGGRTVLPRRMMTCHHIRVQVNGTRKDRVILPAKCALVRNGAVLLPTGSLTTSPLRAAPRNVRRATPRHLTLSQRQHLLQQLRMAMTRGHLSKSQRQHLLQQLRRAMTLHPGARWRGPGWYSYAPATGPAFPPGLAGAPRVIGSGWTAVAIFPAGGLTSGAAGGAAGALLRSATPVHGSWGSGRLLRTSLFSVLITSNGKALIGAVTPSLLYAAAGQVK